MASLIFFFSFIIFIFFLRSLSSSSHSKTSSPHSYPIVGNLFAFLRNRHRFHDWVSDMLSQTPSSTLRVHLFLDLSPGICTANPSNIEHLLLSNFPNYIKGSRFNDVLDDFLGDGIFNADGHLWTIQRKIASYEFNTKSLRRFISKVVDSEISNRLIPYLSLASDDESRIIDFQDLLQKFSFDNICNVAFGTDPACLELHDLINQSANSNFVNAFDEAVVISSARFLSPLPIVWKMKRILNLGSEKRFKRAVKLINDYAMEIIKSRENELKSKQEESSEKQDLLSRFMLSSSQMDFENESSRRKFLRDIVISFILAGRDSTSTALTWFFWLLSGHRRSAQLIYKELSAVKKEKGLGFFSYEKLKKLNYLHASISESLRLFPPVPINSRLTVNDDVLPDGTFVGKGWYADYSAYATGRMERVWGEDCREFKPERWLDGDGVFQPADQFKFPVFHCGPRMCLGKEMAYVQMKSVAAAVLNEFEIVAVDGGGKPEKMAAPPCIISLLLKMRGGLPVRVKRRSEEWARHGREWARRGRDAGETGREWARHGRDAGETCARMGENGRDAGETRRDSAKKL